MAAQEVWANLEKIFHLTPRELYEQPDLEQMHRTCRQHVQQMSKSQMRETLSHYVRDVMLSDAALARGDGWEVVLAFLDWVDGGME